MFYTRRPMPLYSAPTTRSYQRRFRIFGWGAIAVLIGIFLFSIYEPEGTGRSTDLALAWLAGAIVLAAVVVVYVLSFKEAKWKVMHTFQWELTTEKLIQRHEDGATGEIPLAQIASLHEYHGWLLVRGGEPQRLIGIPSDVNGFEDLKRELTTHCAVTPLKIKFSPWSFLPHVLLIAAIFFLVKSHNRIIVLTAGCTAILLQGRAFYSLRRRWQNKPTYLLFIATYVLSCLVIAWWVFQQTTAAQ